VRYFTEFEIEMTALLGGSRRLLRRSLPRRQIEIIGELATWPILPILQTMFGGAKWQPARRGNHCVQLAPEGEQFCSS
jgi:hypothetical protein